MEAKVDINAYQHKKTLAKGMMDIALLTANANQLRYVIEIGNEHPYFVPSITMISLSLLVQVVVGILLILNSHYDITNGERGEDYEHKLKGEHQANKLNDLTVTGIFLITIINVLISAFCTADTRAMKPS